MTAWKKWWKSSDQSSNLFHTLVPYFENDTAHIWLLFWSLKVQVTYGNTAARKWLEASGLPQLCLFKGFNIPSILIEYNNRKSSWKLTWLIVSKNYQGYSVFFLSIRWGRCFCHVGALCLLSRPGTYYCGLANSDLDGQGPTRGITHFADNLVIGKLWISHLNSLLYPSTNF